MKYESVRKTARLLQLEALMPRLKQSHLYYQKLNQQYGQDLAGYLGEKNLRYHFEFIQAKEGHHLSGLRLKGRTFFTQIDHLIATPTVIFVIESKHRKGLISQNSDGQYLQRYDKNKIIFDNPRNQVEIQKRQLEYILKMNDFPRIPIIPLVAFTHDTVQLDASITSPDVMVAQNVSFFINDHLKDKQQRYYNLQQLNRLKKLLTKLNTPREVDIINEFKIRASDLNCGVLCEDCRRVFVQRAYNTWTCPRCKKSDRSTHIQALRSYAYLFEPYINNRTARWWLNLECTSLTYRLLSRFPVVEQVGRKAIQYNLSSLI